MSNNTLTPLTFTLSTTTPFHVMAEEGGRGRHHDNKVQRSEQLTLYPRQNVTVRKFLISTKSLPVFHFFKNFSYNKKNKSFYY